MADYGAPVGIPNGTGPEQAPQPVPSGTPPPAQDSGHPFNEDAVDSAFAKTFSSHTSQPAPSDGNQPDPNDVQKLQSAASNPSGDQRQFSGVNAQGSPGQLAQAGIGRNVNERLQIWSKLVGDNNAMIGPPIAGQSDVWIRGDDQKFHPADTGHTDFMQDVAKKTGAGIDVVTTSLAALAGAATEGPIGAAIGYAVGPGLSSAGREFLMSRMYDVKSKAPGELLSGQFKRDAAIGGAMNLFMGATMSGMSNIGNNVASSIMDSPSVRMAKVADAQLKAQTFMDAVGARPSNIITENGIESPMSDAGSRLISATQYKRGQLNDLLATAKEQIVAASPAKVQTQGLASVIKDFMQKDGVPFDENGMPKPYDNVNLYGKPSVEVDQQAYHLPNSSSSIGSPYYSSLPSRQITETPNVIGSVSDSVLNRPRMGSEAMSQLSEDYKGLASGQMPMDGFLKMIHDWQENANFKMLDQRSDATRSGWAQVQHMATQLRQQEIQSRLSNDPDMLNAVNNAYHEYSSSQDAINMVMDSYAKNQNSPEKLAQTFIQPGKQTLLSQANSLFADKPQIMKDVRSAWLSEKMGNHVGDDGVFNANSFIGDLKSTGGETLKQLFKPEELGSIYRAGKIMGSIKTSDLMTQAQGQNVVDALGDVAKTSSSASLAKPWAILKFLENKPKLADYVSSPEGLSKLAAKQKPRTAAAINTLSSIIRNKIVQSTATEAIRSTQMAQKINPFPRLVSVPPMTPMPQGSQGSDAAAAETFK